MARSLIGKIVNRASVVPHSSRWNIQGGYLYGSGFQDRFTQLSAMGWQGTLFAIVQLLSTGQAKANWSMFRLDKDGRVRYSKSDIGSDQRTEVLQHQALKLWDRPNRFMTGYQFREIGWQFMELVGEWYWVMDRGRSGKGVPIEMWPVRPDRMDPIPDRDKFLLGWLYTGPNGEQVPLDAEEVIQMRYPHPTDFFRGLSPVQGIMADIDANKYTAEWSRNFFLNSAMPGGIVQFQKRLSDEEFTEFSDRWRESHQGVSRGHRVGVLEQGATWIPNTYTIKDMQFVELRQLTRDVIREAYRIHQAMLGDSTDVNRANAQTAEEVHVAWHEVSRLERTRDTLNHFFLPCFGTTAPGREFDFADPTPTSTNDANDELTAKTKAAQALVAAGYDPSDVLTVVGLPGMAFSGAPGTYFGYPGGPPEPAASPTHPAVETGAHPSLAQYRPRMAITPPYPVQQHSDSPPGMYESSTAHLIESASHDLAHSRRHMAQLSESVTPEQKNFNAEHLRRHIESAANHVGKLAIHVRDNYPAESAEFLALDRAHPSDFPSCAPGPGQPDHSVHASLSSLPYVENELDPKIAAEAIRHAFRKSLPDDETLAITRVLKENLNGHAKREGV